MVVIVFITLPSGLYQVTFGVGSPSETQLNSTSLPTCAAASAVLMLTITAGLPHGLVLHSRDLSLSPMQTSPPYAGEGLLQLRV